MLSISAHWRDLARASSISGQARQLLVGRPDSDAVDNLLLSPPNEGASGLSIGLHLHVQLEVGGVPVTRCRCAG